MILFRGQYNRTNDFSTRLGSTSFTEHRAIAELYARHPNQRGEVAEVSAIFTCEFEPRKLAFDSPGDSYIDWGPLIKLLGMYGAYSAYRLLCSTLVDLNGWVELCHKYNVPYAPTWTAIKQYPEMVRFLSFPIWRILDEPFLVDMLIKEGYDSVHYLAPGGKAEWRILDTNSANIKVLEIEVLE